MRDVAEAKLGYSTPGRGAQVGLLLASDALADGTRATSTQVLLGGKLALLKERLLLSAQHAQSLFLNQNEDFPTRSTLGAEYRLTEAVSALAAQEWVWADGAVRSNTRLGLRSTPWSGATLMTSAEGRLRENEARVLGNIGLRQTWQVSRHWRVDGALERGQTVVSQGAYEFNPNDRESSSREDFSAVSAGSSLGRARRDSRAEARVSEREHKWRVQSGVVAEVGKAWAWSGRGPTPGPGWPPRGCSSRTPSCASGWCSDRRRPAGWCWSAWTSCSTALAGHRRAATLRAWSTI